ncbi:MAG TPA: hypothetical protein VGN22_10640 [Pseudonocardia sp.]|jgi:hypothetical protein
MDPFVVLTLVGAAAGLAVLLVMALTPLFTDLHRPRSDRPPGPAAKPTTDPTVVIPTQRGALGLVPPAARVARLRAASR